MKIMQVDLDNISNIYFIGIGGIGLSAVAKLMKNEGKEVSGSDTNLSQITENLEKEGIKIYKNHSAENIAEKADLIVYTTAIKENNPELKEAVKRGIKIVTYPQVLGALFNNKHGVAICGTHGKSSTTAIAGLLLDDAGLDPNIIVGSVIPRYESNLRTGRSGYFVVEACEYERSFLNLYPKIIILNNIELDHTDYYKNLKDVENAFEEFISHLPEDGILICNGDDEKSQKFIKSKVHKVISFGLGEKNNVRADNVEFENGMTKFKVFYNKKDLGEFILKIPGLFNVYNALAVISLGLALNISCDIMRESLKNYSGIWRRFEIKGTYKKAMVISDYAHHPTEVSATIEAAKQFYSGKRIFVVFQPHQHNRTSGLYEEFTKSFDDADFLILSEIFDVFGREEKKDQNVSSLDLVNDIKKINKNLKDKIFYAKNLEKTKEIIDREIRSDDILLIIGAGDIYKVADDLTENK